MTTVLQTELPTLKLFRRGKVRDVYDLGTELLMIATDRISAFDVVMNEPVPGKGRILTEVSLFWFSAIEHIVAHHVITSDVSEMPSTLQQYRELLEGRSMLVRKTTPLPIECVVRGYLAGSGWKEYQEKRMVCGIPLPDGLLESSKLSAPIFTPATKAESGHDMNISFDEACAIVGEETAVEVRRLSLELYDFASEFAQRRGMILADTKFEFGKTDSGEIILIDEVMTPDSSRYWLQEEYAPGRSQVNFDKQVLRDYLETLPWNKQPPPPTLPPEILEQTRLKYLEAKHRLVGVK